MKSYYAVQAVPGVDGEIREALIRAARIRTRARLLAATARKRDREILAAKSGIDERKLLDLANAADLMRVELVSTVYAQAILDAGVPTVRMLRGRNPKRLHQLIVNQNRRTGLMEFPPPLSVVRRWVEHAKTLDVVITYEGRKNEHHHLQGSRLPEWRRDGWRPNGPGYCNCPDCGVLVPTNALARASHVRSYHSKRSTK